MPIQQAALFRLKEEELAESGPIPREIRRELLDEGGVLELDQPRGYAKVNLQDPRFYCSPLVRDALGYIGIQDEDFAKLEGINHPASIKRLHGGAGRGAPAKACPNVRQVDLAVILGTRKDADLETMLQRAHETRLWTRITDESPVILFFEGKMMLVFPEETFQEAGMRVLAAAAGPTT